MAARPVQPDDDVGYRIADAGNLPQPAFRDDALERLGQRRQALCGPQIRLRTIGIAAASAVRRPYSARSFATSEASNDAIGSHSEVLKRDAVSKIGDHWDGCC
jgi:hypothetical protein